MTGWRRDQHSGQCRHCRDRREWLLHVPRGSGDGPGRDTVRRSLRPGLPRHRRGAAGGVPAAARGRARVPAAPDQLPGQPLGAALDGSPPGPRPLRRRRSPSRRRRRRRRRARPARRPHPRPHPELRGDRGGARAVRRPVLRAAVQGRRRRRRLRAARRHNGGGRGPALLHPRRVAALRRTGLVAGQHDRAPRGGPGPGAAHVLRRGGPGHRHGRRCRGRVRGGSGGGVRDVRAQRRTPQGASCQDDCRPTRSRTLFLLDLGRGPRADVPVP